MVRASKVIINTASNSRKADTAADMIRVLNTDNKVAMVRHHMANSKATERHQRPVTLAGRISSSNLVTAVRRNKAGLHTDRDSLNTDSRSMVKINMASSNSSSTEASSNRIPTRAGRGARV